MPARACLSVALSINKQGTHEMTRSLSAVVNLEAFPISTHSFQAKCKQTLDENGALVLRRFLTPDAVDIVQSEGERQKHLAYFTVDDHNIYLAPPDPDYPPEHPRNRLISSSKGCITDDQIPADSVLRVLYGAPEFQAFLCAVLGEVELHPYADALSSINVHYAGAGQELGWHFDNSSFAITLLIQKPESGGDFEYVKDVRDADAGQLNYEASEKVLDGEISPKELDMDPGTLVMFRGRNSMHRVTPSVGDRARMLVVFAYNAEAGISLSESARLTFYGRVE